MHYQRTVQRQLLHLGELNTIQQNFWQHTLAVLHEGGSRHPCRLFTDREGPPRPTATWSRSNSQLRSQTAQPLRRLLDRLLTVMGDDVRSRRHQDPRADCQQPHPPVSDWWSTGGVATK